MAFLSSGVNVFKGASACRKCLNQRVGQPGLDADHRAGCRTDDRIGTIL